MPKSCKALRLIACGLLTTILISGFPHFAFAETQTGPLSAYFNIIPAEKSEHSTTTSYTRINTAKAVQFSSVGALQAVNDPALSSTSLEVVHVHTGHQRSSLDLSSQLDSIEGAGFFHQNSSKGAPLNIIVRGKHQGVSKGLLVSSASVDDISEASIMSLDDVSSLDFDKVRVIDGANNSLLVVYQSDSGELLAKRLDYSFSKLSEESETKLPFEGSQKLFYNNQTGILFEADEGGINTVSLENPEQLRRIELPGFGLITHIEQKGDLALVSDSAGKIAVVNAQSQSVSASFDLPGPSGDIALVSKMNEVLVASSDGSTIWRHGTDGEKRTTINLGNAQILPGSLNSAIDINISNIYTAKIGESTYRYFMNYAADYVVEHLGELRASEKGAPVDLTIHAVGSGPMHDYVNKTWEYSLDDGKNWSSYSQPWSSAKPDIGNFIEPQYPLPPPRDGIAPYLSVNVTSDGLRSRAVDMSTENVILPFESYDGIWRARISNSQGSIVTQPTRIIFGVVPDDKHAISFDSHPLHTAVTLGDVAQFRSAASGVPNPQISWEIQRVGAEWESLDLFGEILSHKAEIRDHLAKIRAVAENGFSREYSDIAELSVIPAPDAEIGAAPPGAVVVADAGFNFQINNYSNDWLREARGSSVAISPDKGFDWSGGTGWTDQKSGATQILWDGTAIYKPYSGMNGLNLTFANLYLSIDTLHRATLTADVFWGSGSYDSGGFRRVVIATFTDTQTQSINGLMTFTATPEWDNRRYVAPGFESARKYESSFPASVLDYLPAALRPWFLATGNRPADKPGIPIMGKASVTSELAGNSGQVISATDPLADGQNHFALSAPRVVSSPSSQHVSDGAEITLFASAAGNPAPDVQWQRYSENKWQDIPTATAEELVITDSVVGEFKVRAQFSNSIGTVSSNTALISVAERAIISQLEHHSPVHNVETFSQKMQAIASQPHNKIRAVRDSSNSSDAQELSSILTNHDATTSSSIVTTVRPNRKHLSATITGAQLAATGEDSNIQSFLGYTLVMLVLGSALTCYARSRQHDSKYGRIRLSADQTVFAMFENR